VLRVYVRVADCSADVCRSVQCQNGGSCVAKDADQATCLCPLGTHGHLCQHRTCSSSSQRYFSVLDRISRTANTVLDARTTPTCGLCKGKGKGRTLVIVPQVDPPTTEALRYMARTEQRRTYLPLYLPTILTLI